MGHRPGTFKRELARCHVRLVGRPGVNHLDHRRAKPFDHRRVDCLPVAGLQVADHVQRSFTGLGLVHRSSEHTRTVRGQLCAEQSRQSGGLVRGEPLDVEHRLVGAAGPHDAQRTARRIRREVLGQSDDLLNRLLPDRASALASRAHADRVVQQHQMVHGLSWPRRRVAVQPRHQKPDAQHGQRPQHDQQPVAELDAPPPGPLGGQQELHRRPADATIATPVEQVNEHRQGGRGRAGVQEGRGGHEQGQATGVTRHRGPPPLPRWRIRAARKPAKAAPGGSAVLISR